MKKTLFIMVAMLISMVAFTFTSCSKDDEFEGNSLTGTWEENHSEGNYYFIYVFNSDGTFKETEYLNGEPAETGIGGTYVTQNGNITFTYSDEYTVTIPYTMTKNTFSMGNYSYTRIQ